MAVITPDTFDPLRRYVGVRLQQGVPIVDADENEREDIRKFEVRAFLKWFVGNGIAEGNEGSFQVAVTGASMQDDFAIRSGASAGPATATKSEFGLNSVGRCLVDGLDVIIDADVNFQNQPLHVDKAGSLDLAKALVVPQIAKIPDIDGTVLAFLDVWERPVKPTEDHSLVLPGLGTESCARTKREWVVRVDVALPKPADLPHHSFYPLARITRRKGDPNVNPDDVFDLRELHLQVMPTTVIADAFGGSLADYRQGASRPLISLREAINALLKGQIPSTPDAPVATSAAGAVSQVSRFGDLLDATSSPVAFWTGVLQGGVEQIVAARLDPNNIAGGFAAPVPLTNGPDESTPQAVLLPGGNKMLAVYTKRTTVGVLTKTNIVFKIGRLEDLANATEQAVTVSGTASPVPFAVVAGGFVTVFFLDSFGLAPIWGYRRFKTDGSPVDASPLPLNSFVGASSGFHAQPARDSSGAIWVAFTSLIDLWVVQYIPATNTLFPPAASSPILLQAGPGAGNHSQPFVLCQANGTIWVFWATQDGTLFFASGTAGQWTASPVAVTPTQVTSSLIKDTEPCAVEDADGGIWLFCTGADKSIAYQRFDPISNAWGARTRVTFSGHDFAPFALLAPNRAIWLFWSSDRVAPTQTYFKRLVATL